MPISDVEEFYRSGLEYAERCVKKFFDKHFDDDSTLCSGPDSGDDFNAYLRSRQTDWQTLLKEDEVFAHQFSDEFHQHHAYEYRCLLVRMSRPLVN